MTSATEAWVPVPGVDGCEVSTLGRVRVSGDGPPADDAQARHLNGVKDDNRPENLAWGTAKENGADRTRHAIESATPCPVQVDGRSCRLPVAEPYGEHDRRYCGVHRAAARRREYWKAWAAAFDAKSAKVAS